MEIQNSFFEDEVIDGFYVPAMIKRAWGAELRVLAEIDRICRKYDIQYFADWGSLIGTVRHEGFIPWDDDLDICMKRADYKKFLEVADKELKDDYKVFTYDRHPDFWLFLARVVAKPHISFEKEHLDKFNQFPYIVGVDIFILDYISADDEFEKERAKKVKFVIEAADAICTQDLTEDVIDRFIDTIEQYCLIKVPQELKFYKFKGIDTGKNSDKSVYERCKYDFRVFLYKQAEKIFEIVDYSDAEYIGQMIPHYLYNNVKFPKEYYEKEIRLPFEMYTMPVSMTYDAMLKRKYGDYMKLVKSTGGHDYPFYETQQKSLDEILSREGIVYSDKFEYEQSEIERLNSERKESKENSYKSLLSECYNELIMMQNEICCAISENNIDKVLELLGSAQQLSIDMGNLIESCKGDGFITVSYIQDYCENIFITYESIINNSFDIKYLDDIEESLEKIKNSLEKDIFNRKEVVFIISHINKWKYFEAEYNLLSNDENYDVYVMVIPYYYKKFDGTFYDMKYEANLFCVNAHMLKYDEYDFGLRHPEMIYIQNPYDGYNPVTSEHSFFYSSNIRKYTDKLIYVSTFVLEDFKKENYREYHNMKHYCTVPGVVNADEVIVYSDCIRERYIDKLVEFAGKETARIWEKKIISKVCECRENVINIPDKWHKRLDEHNKKVVLYHTGICGYIEYKEKMLDKIRSVLDIFYDNRENIQLIWRPHKATETVLEEYNTAIYSEYLKLVRKYKEEAWGIFDYDEEEDVIVSVCDAYYGDSTPIVRKFRNNNKPIMIQKVDFIINS